MIHRKSRIILSIMKILFIMSISAEAIQLPVL